jgi:hypothetical protein
MSAISRTAVVARRMRPMNAVERMAPLIASDAVRRLAALRVQRFDRTRVPARTAATNEQAVATVIARWGNDLCALLNAMTRDELADLATAMRVSIASRSARDVGSAHDASTSDSSKPRADELRVALWERGAEIERDGVSVSTMIQPRPIVLGGHLVVQAPPRGMAPMTTAYPRDLPEPRPWVARADEPDSIDELLDAATDAIGVRLGARGRDKGAWGVRAAQLLGVVERGLDEPDWRGDVEIKTVPVAREANGYWNVVEDPAIAMVGERGIAKLQRTLWLARATVAPEGNEDEDATIVSWYLLEWDAHVARLARRYLHERPKGPRGTTQKGMYLHKRFFADAGMLATLNGVA